MNDVAYMPAKKGPGGDGACFAERVAHEAIETTEKIYDAAIQYASDYLVNSDRHNCPGSPNSRSAEYARNETTH